MYTTTQQPKVEFQFHLTTNNVARLWCANRYYLRDFIEKYNLTVLTPEQHRQNEFGGRCKYVAGPMTELLALQSVCNGSNWIGRRKHTIAQVYVPPHQEDLWA